MEKHQQQSGFTIIEMAVVMVILSLAVAGGLSIFARSADVDKTRLTKQRMEKITLMLDRYYSKYTYLPCPANHLLGVNSAGFGAWAGSATNSCDGAVLEDNGTVYKGAVPVGVLGLHPDYMVDGWGRQFSYIIGNAGPGGYGAAPVVNNPQNSTVTSNNGSTTYTNYTVSGSITNRILVVTVGGIDNNATRPTSATFNGIAMTALALQNTTQNNFTRIFYLTETAGSWTANQNVTGNIVVTYTGGDNLVVKGSFKAITLGNVRQQAPEANGGVHEADTTTPDTSIAPTVTNGIIIGTISSVNNTNYSVNGSGQTQYGSPTEIDMTGGTNFSTLTSGYKLFTSAGANSLNWSSSLSTAHAYTLAAFETVAGTTISLQNAANASVARDAANGVVNPSYLLISHGRNGFGAMPSPAYSNYTNLSVKINDSRAANARDMENDNTHYDTDPTAPSPAFDTTFRSLPIRESAAGTNPDQEIFDDIIVWRSATTLTGFTNH